MIKNIFFIESALSVLFKIEIRKFHLSMLCETSCHLLETKTWRKA